MNKPKKFSMVNKDLSCDLNVKEENKINEKDKIIQEI